ncbi:hypothetical protein E8E12_011654 [Didymella heteroderae]|uniref:Uncharacterized protein n=1 Tax=Didymella heteroderae TaxID=1769908 RepID=A0A9P5C5A2_9PLEO|nr:hypothetical protein E8E12_011654 [Didymella heteroderae]
MQPRIKARVCPVRYCGRLVCAALPLSVLPPFHFDTKTYCLPRCAELHSRDKPLTGYIHKIKEHNVVTDKWNLPVPSGCLPHLAPELLNMEGGSHPTSLLSPELSPTEQGTLSKSQQWLPYAQYFLPGDLHDVFYRQLLDRFIHTTAATLWVCPSDCGYGDGILQPSETAAANSFKGWEQLHQAQQDHIDRNTIADKPFDIGNKASKHKDGVFYYDPDTNLWAADICELDEIAGRAVGRRYVRQEARDRDNLWAFVAIEGGHQGSVSLHEALMLELRPLLSIHIPADVLQILEGPPLNGDANILIGRPFHMVVEGGHVDDQNPAVPALATLDQLINDLSAQEEPHEAQGHGGNEGSQEAGADEQQIRSSF